MILLLQANTFSQSPRFSGFTEKDGLPSNLIYRCLQDDKGFLWIATDAGVARFDGKYFQVFTTEQGLPDNEVLSVVKEKNGRIWVNCFKQSPAYFDERENRFINFRGDTTLFKAFGTSVMLLFALPDGGVMYHNEKGSYVFKDLKLTIYPLSAMLVIKDMGKDGLLTWGGRISNLSSDGVDFGMYHRLKGKAVDSLMKRVSRSRSRFAGMNENSFWEFSGSTGGFTRYSDLKIYPLRYREDSGHCPEPFITADFTPDRLYLIGASGKLYVYDKSTLAPIKVLSGDFLPNSYYNDREGNEWIATIDKGLLVSRKNYFSQVTMPRSFTKTNFLSVAKTNDGKILAGNFYGQIVEVHADKFKVHQVMDVIPSRVRKILVSGNTIYSFSDQGTFVNFRDAVINPYSQTIHPSKNGILINDTSIIAGYGGGLFAFGEKTRKPRRLKAMAKRVTALAKLNDHTAFFGSTDGLYKYDVKADSTTYLSGKNEIPDHRISAIATSNDQIVWVGTGGQGLIVVKDEKLLATLTVNEGIIDNSIRSLATGQSGTLWMGTSRGVSILKYQLENGKFNYTIQNITQNDGLANNEVNDMWFGNDTMYLATADGVAIVAAGSSPPKVNIPLEVINVMVNERHVAVGNHYSLPSGQHNISIRFAGVDLSGHFRNIEYILDDQGEWITSRENTLNLQLPQGSHTLQVRAIDVNGYVSSQVLKIRFDIATPFWKSFWFLFCALAFIQLLVAYIIIRVSRKRKHVRMQAVIAKVETASLKQQAFTSLMNPHFIFNALNSIQHYINLQDRQNANRYLSDFASLIRKNFDAAQKTFIPLEEELESIRIYLRLEQMRFRERFTYQINIHPSIDTDQWMIPSMMLQPILENAILHGMMPSKKPGELELDIRLHGSKLHISITDNGIGYANSRLARNNGSHKSSSMDLIRKRLGALNHFVDEPLQFISEPAAIDAQNPGNRTTIIIPADLYHAWYNKQSPVQERS